MLQVSSIGNAPSVHRSQRKEPRLRQLLTSFQPHIIRDLFVVACSEHEIYLPKPTTQYAPVKSPDETSSRKYLKEGQQFLPELKSLSDGWPAERRNHPVVAGSHLMIGARSAYCTLSS